MALDGAASVRVLETLQTSQRHSFVEPSKKIHEGQDVSTFLTTKAYTDTMTFLLQLNRSMFPSKLPDGTVQTWPLNSDAVEFSEPVRRLQLLLEKLEGILQETPPDKGPRRFGNISFRKWYQVVESRASDLLDECLWPEVLRPENTEPDSPSAKVELIPYFLGSFGSPQRLDYGSGHELSFLAFLACIWKLNGFPKASQGVEERGIVLGVIEPYLQLVRTIIKTYTLEPAGSHGVWGLDDHSFIPYIFGSAQLSPAITETDQTPVEGSLPDAPDPSEVAKAAVVERERKTNMYFSAIGFIYDVKRGPFWEHSPMLYDISGIKAGWAKINKGMIKMYNAEVLSKFPVVQHFPFGSLLSWEKDPNAPPPPSTVHATSGPQARPAEGTLAQAPGTSTDYGARAPWASQSTGPIGATAAPWAASRGPASVPAAGTGPILPDTSRMPPGPMAPTRAPWARDQPPANSRDDPGAMPTRAPWAKS
ncbi:hypothetical protein DTO166G4_7031 [Paecilomyces variotii]|nr:hypothetical protein DTO164E3_2332 [Paecilomyces variotii]KAJ9211409.1 hypothetical protein DTO166G4_7031 [Paecilomyces variotii]KAJ9225884.1 hypothetical protein DTO169C6_1947 [Paecilomyces variotii]KAJ9233929.1 hypothetical protein DTO166G5_5421 [Paecilomyces variotii]KAJ9239705.1 hypothetical protein DTO169E5_4217 [Paecilomyces variotii]